VRTHLTGSLFGQWRAAVLETLRKAGPRGRTDRELSKFCRLFAGLEPRQREQVLKALTEEGLAARVNLGKGASGRGRERIAWVALNDEEDADAA